MRDDGRRNGKEDEGLSPDSVWQRVERSGNRRQRRERKREGMQNDECVRRRVRAEE
jgi:hypothetical protein